MRSLAVRALRFDPWRHPFTRRLVVAIHVVRGRPAISRVDLTVVGGIELHGVSNARVRMFETTLTRKDVPLLTLGKGADHGVFERVRFNGGGGGTALYLGKESGLA